jgi:hypothetical protein
MVRMPMVRYGTDEISVDEALEERARRCGKDRPRFECVH